MRSRPHHTVDLWSVHSNPTISGRLDRTWTGLGPDLDQTWTRLLVHEIATGATKNAVFRVGGPEVQVCINSRRAFECVPSSAASGTNLDLWSTWSKNRTGDTVRRVFVDRKSGPTPVQLRSTSGPPRLTAIQTKFTLPPEEFLAGGGDRHRPRAAVCRLAGALECTQQTETSGWFR